jgi:hypothetical protein
VLTDRGGRAAFAGAALLVGCSGPTRVENPVATLQTPGLPPREYLAAMQVADRNPQDEAYHAALRRMVVTSNYSIDARRAAYARLREIDRQGLKDMLDVNLSKVDAVAWRRELCERIAADNWVEMTPALIRAWAQPMPAYTALGQERPERAALAKLHGADHVVETLLKAMAEANPITQANLRARCWELLLLEGQEARLRELIANESTLGKDGMLRDIRAGVVDLGVLPRTREEILWLRWLRDPTHESFWNSAKSGIAKLSAERHAALELRDLAVIVTAEKTRPELITLPDAALDARIVERTGGSDRRLYSPDFQGHDHGAPEYFSERFAAAQKKLTWGDRAAMLLALDALTTPELKRHLFETADRDIGDKSTEYGGMIALDDRGRYELVEFPSRSRGNDARYEAPPGLMDALRLGLFHVHFHAQSYDNARYAGPHLGDFQFADNNRCNCLVFSFVDSDRLDIDFYRYDRVVVDLNVTERP